MEDGDVSDMRGKGGGDHDLWTGLQGTPNHPARLLGGGLLGPRGGGRGEGNGLSPGLETEPKRGKIHFSGINGGLYL